MLIAGCSHTAGSEIDGSLDSFYNRSKSYGNVLAKKLGYEPINIAIGGFTNAAISRSVMSWFEKNYKNQEVFVLIGWTESARIEAPYPDPCWYHEANPYCDWFDNSCINFLQINAGYKGYQERERSTQESYQRFIVENEKYMEIVSINLVLQIQYFLKYHKANYLMCNSSHMFNLPCKHLRSYIKNMDTKRYIKYHDNNQSFWFKYQELGYKNSKAMWNHHGEEPHALYAEELYNYIIENELHIKFDK